MISGKPTTLESAIEEFQEQVEKLYASFTRPSRFSEIVGFKVLSLNPGSMASLLREHYRVSFLVDEPEFGKELVRLLKAEQVIPEEQKCNMKPALSGGRAVLGYHYMEKDKLAAFVISPAANVVLNQLAQFCEKTKVMSPQIVLLAADEQKGVAESKIPVVDRNQHTGWPLLQVSLFTVDVGKSKDKIIYTHVLGGGNCYYLNVGGFLFAKMLTKVPPFNQITVKIGNNHSTPEKFTIENILDILKGYRIAHGKFKITIEETTGMGYGKVLNATTPVSQGNTLAEVLGNSFSLAMKKQTGIESTGWWGDESFTERQIKDAINPECAIFSNGQVFVDLGLLLSKARDKHLLCYFEKVFQVDKFLQWSKDALLPKSPLVVPSDDSTDKEEKQVAVGKSVIEPVPEKSSLLQMDRLLPTPTGEDQAKKNEMAKERPVLEEKIRVGAQQEIDKIKEMIRSMPGPRAGNWERFPVLFKATPQEVQGIPRRSVGQTVVSNDDTTVTLKK